MADRTDHGATPSEKARDHLAHIEGHVRTKVEEIRALARVGEVSIDGIMSVFKELVRASTTNPLIGAAVAVIFADLLTQLKVIQPGTRNIIFGFAAVGFGAEIATEMMSSTTQLLDTIDPFKNTPTNNATDVMRPTATTVVYGNETPAIAGAASRALPSVPAGAALEAAVL